MVWFFKWKWFKIVLNSMELALFVCCQKQVALFTCPHRYLWDCGAVELLLMQPLALKPICLNHRVLLMATFPLLLPSKLKSTIILGCHTVDDGLKLGEQYHLQSYIYQSCISKNIHVTVYCFWRIMRLCNALKDQNCVMLLKDYATVKHFQKIMLL